MPIMNMPIVQKSTSTSGRRDILIRAAVSRKCSKHKFLQRSEWMAITIQLDYLVKHVIGSFSCQLVMLVVCSFTKCERKAEALIKGFAASGTIQ